ncbi:MAG: Mannonate dehydratase [Verrucomicrobia bacterium]|nr:Mannonate dehydratase [Verrucomicrobiota bacterium]
MKLSAVITPPTDENFRLLAQLGVPDLVYYNMNGMPAGLEALRQEQERAARAGLRLAAVEGGPPIDRIVLGKDGRDAQIEEYKRALEAMGRLGIGVLCYNFMPQITADAMVIRTSTTVRERGGAVTSGFDLSAFDRERVTSEGRTTDEQMWDNLEYFLRRVVPAAEAAGVRLAMHPDDPPLSPMWQLARIMRSVENFDRLLALAPSPANGITLCQGCFAELGADLCATIRHFRGRINFVHCRDVSGRLEKFHETFPDNGPTDLVKVFQTYREIGYDGFIRSDHVPHLVTDPGAHDGYGLHGNIFAIGYLKGLMEPIFGKPDAPPALGK